MKLDGIYPALITPFTEVGNIDESALGAMVADLLSQGVTGLYVGGSTGEALLMNSAERKRTLEIVAENVNGRAQILAHIGCFHTGDSIALAKHAAGLGVDAISSLPPFYYKFTMNELTHYYLSIVDAVPLPMIVYNVPALTGIAFDSDTIEPIFAHPLVTAVKYTAYDLFQMQRMIAKYPDKTVICGHDELYLSTLSIGTRCAIGSTFNFMAPKFIKLRTCFANGEMEQALKLQDEVNRIIEVLTRVGVFRGIKGVLNLLGKPGGFCRSPFLPLTSDEMQVLEEILPLVTAQEEP